jgi:hypothetical protein
VNDRTLLGSQRRSLLAGLAASVGAVAVATVVIYPLKSVAPTVSLGVVYLPLSGSQAAIWSGS